ncbi:hypothetical protein CsSME_00013990 [Camellia sinensis var. sinensis]
MAGFGMLIVGPSQHMWFNFVAKILPKRDVITTLKKMITGQVLYGPCVNGSFFSFNAALQGTQQILFFPLINSSFSYIWTIYLTYMANLKKAGIV